LIFDVNEQFCKCLNVVEDNTYDCSIYDVLFYNDKEGKIKYIDDLKLLPKLFNENIEI